MKLVYVFSVKLKRRGENMALLFKTQGEDIILWHNYFAARILEPKTTGFGSYGKKVCLSIGQELKSEKEIEKSLKECTPEVRKKIEKLVPQYKTLDEYVKQGIKKSFYEKLKAVFIGLYKKVRGVLGVEISESDGALELFHYAKFSNVENYMPVFIGTSMGFGALCQINRIKKDEMMKKLKKQFKYMEESALKGYEKAWKNDDN